MRGGNYGPQPDHTTPDPDDLMFISEAFAQTADAASSKTDILASVQQFAPLLLIFGVFYFLLIRPQQQKQKELKAALSAVKRGDKVITGGGILGTVVKAPEADVREIEIEIAPGVKVQVLRETITGVVQPKAANDSKPADAKK